MFFSVIITTYNRPDFLRMVLEAYLLQSVDQQDFELIIADDGSDPATKKVAMSFSKSFKNFVYFRQQNSGQGVARNNAIKKAKAKIIVFGQDDIVPSRDFLFEHQKFHYLHKLENEAVLGFTAWHPQIMLNDYMLWSTNGSSLFGFFGGQQFAYEKLKGKQLADYRFFYTSNISLKTSLLKRYPFDPAFMGYGYEDIELGYRLFKMEKMLLYYNPNALAYHYHHMDHNDLEKRMISVGESAVIFNRKYPSLNKVPSFLKTVIFKVLSSDMTIALLFFLKKSGIRFFTSLYYYSLSKKFFLIGLKKGRAKYYDV